VGDICASHAGRRRLRRSTSKRSAVAGATAAGSRRALLLNTKSVVGYKLHDETVQWLKGWTLALKDGAVNKRPWRGQGRRSTAAFKLTFYQTIFFTPSLITSFWTERWFLSPSIRCQVEMLAEAGPPPAVHRPSASRRPPKRAEGRDPLLRSN
jgi:hypothetical protein